tara:strand:+ start:667 stop:801 length:135 start_codon:yes stop_codon:yes gene_type:complete
MKPTHPVNNNRVERTPTYNILIGSALVMFEIRDELYLIVVQIIR